MSYPVMKEAVGVKLAKALDELKKKLAIEEEFELVWVPTEGPLSGEIKGQKIYIYESEEAKALETIKHEIFDFYVTSRIVRPLVKIINLLVKSAESNVYEAKEEVIKKLVNLCSQTAGCGRTAEIQPLSGETGNLKVKMQN